MKKLLFLIAFVILASNLFACSQRSGNIRATDNNAIEKIKIGKTTKAEVRSLLGDTSNIMREGNKETWTYTYNQTDIGARAFIPFANLVGESPIGVNISTLMILFNSNEIVENVISNTSGNK